MPKIKNVEILRFIFILQIGLCHLICSKGFFNTLANNVPLYKDLGQTAGKGAYGVEFFFIIAGFFLVYTFKDISVKEFIIKKIKRLLPPVALSLFVLLIVTLFTGNTKHFDLYISIFTLTFTSHLGFLHNQRGYIWFSSALFWGLIFYFYCIKYFSAKYNNLIFAILAILSYAILLNLPHGFGNVTPNVFNFLNVGLLRAIGGIGVGYFIGCWYKNNHEAIKNTCVNNIQKIMYTAAEAFLLYFITIYRSFHTFRHNTMIFIYAFIALFILFLLKRGYISKLFDCNLSAGLGKYTYCIYCMETAYYEYLSVYIKRYLAGGG